MNDRYEATDMARALAEALLKKDYSGGSVLSRKVDAKIEEFADEIALEVVRGNPEVEEIIRRKTRELVSAALSGDQELNRFVVRAVSRALSTRALGDEDQETTE